MIDLIAIRARDADYNDVFEAQASMSKDIAHRLVAWPVADRRALLAYVDALAAEAESLRSRLAEAEALLREARQCFFLWCNGFMPILKTGRCINDIDTVLHANNANVSVRCPDCVDGAYAGTDRICLTCSGLGTLKRAADIDAHLAREEKP